MQRIARNLGLHSLCVCLHSRSPYPTKALQLVPPTLHDFCWFSSSSSSVPSNSGKHRAQKTFSRLSLTYLLRRTKGIRKSLQFLDTITAWDPVQTPLALRGLGVSFNCYVVSEVIGKCSNCDIALQFFNWLKGKDDFTPDSYVYNALLQCLAKAGKTKDMEAIASLAIKDGKATPVMFNTLLSAYKSAKDIAGVARTWKHMQELGLKPCAVTYTILMDAFGSLKMYEDAGECYLHMLNAGFRPTIRTCSTLIYYLAEEGKLAEAFEIFDKLAKVKLRPNAITHAILMLGYAKAGDIDAVLKLIERFKEYGHSPLNLGKSFTEVLRYLVREGRVEDVERVMETAWPDSSVEERRQKIVEFQSESQRDALCYGDSWGEGMDSEADSDGGQELEDYSAVNYTNFEEKAPLNAVAFIKCISRWSAKTAKVLANASVKWDSHLVLAILTRSRNAGSVWKFYQWVGQQPGYQHDRYACGTVVRLLSRYGQFDRVRQLLLEAQKNQLCLTMSTYNSILKQCGLSKNGDFVIEVFDLLKESGLRPDEECYKSFIHSLYACGRHWRMVSACSEMKKAGFPLDETLYSFLVASFVEAGKLSIAKRFNKKMREAGFRPSAQFLSALIKSFYKIGRIDKAERVYRGMRQAGLLPPPQACNLMAKILSKTGQHDEVKELKAEMRALNSEAQKVKQTFRVWYLHYHSVFVDGLKGNANGGSALGHSMIAGGV